MRRFRIAGSVATVIVALTLVVSIPGAGHTSPAPVTRVVATAQGLTLDGSPWWPTGFNAYQLATDWAVNQGCGAMVDLDRYFAALPDHSVTRFDAFQSLATNRFTGVFDFGPMDAVFAAAEAHDQLVIPVLAAQDGACEDGVFKDRQWYVDGWSARPSTGTANFHDWVSTAVGRWMNSPALAAWELVGEPETSSCTDAACSWWTRTCEPGAAQILRAFFDTAGVVVRQLDPRTPITAGLTGGGQCGTQGDEYRSVGASPYVDVLQYHDYGADGVALPGDQWNGLARRIEQASSLGKPLLVGEIGELAGACADTATRAAHVGAKIAGQRAAGTAGALLWSFVPDPRPNECTYDIGYDDPLWPVVDTDRSEDSPAQGSAPTNHGEQ